jgi:hypothetical protein
MSRRIYGYNRSLPEYYACGDLFRRLVEQIIPAIADVEKASARNSAMPKTRSWYRSVPAPKYRCGMMDTS